LKLHAKTSILLSKHDQHVKKNESCFHPRKFSEETSELRGFSAENREKKKQERRAKKRRVEQWRGGEERRPKK